MSRDSTSAGRRWRAGFALLLAWSSLFLLPARAATNITVALTAQELWKDTGVAVSTSDVVVIRDAAGAWGWGSSSIFGPDGDPNGEYLYDDWLPSLRKGMLIGFVGPNPYEAPLDDARFFAIGTASVAVSGKVGELWLGFNDDAITRGTGDNVGSVTAIVSYNQPDILPTLLEWNPQHDQIKYRYRIANADLDKDTTAALCWAKGTTLADVIGPPVYDTPIPRAQRDYGDFYVPYAYFGQPPDGATHILLAMDPTNLVVESIENNNTKALALDRVDLAAVKLVLDLDKANAVCTYSVSGADAPAGTRIGVYWATGQTAADIIGTVFEQDLNPYKVGTWQFYRSALPMPPPPLATHALLVIDPPAPGNPNGSVLEAREDNNVYPFPLCGASSKTTILGYVGTTDRREKLHYGGSTVPYVTFAEQYRKTSVPRAVRLTNKQTNEEKTVHPRSSCLDVAVKFHG